MSSVKQIVDILMKNSPSEKANGCKIYRDTFSKSRYLIDFADDFSLSGWQQYDTDQDASYFGVWVNPKLYMTLTYAEGDWCLVVAPDCVAYNAEIKEMNEFYGEGCIMQTIDYDRGLGIPDLHTIYRQDRSKFSVPVSGGGV